MAVLAKKSILINGRLQEKTLRQHTLDVLSAFTALFGDEQKPKPFAEHWFRFFQIPDEEAIPIAFDLLEHEGLCMGGSTGVNVAGAIRLAKQMGPGHTIVTILCDYGTRYASKIFNPAFLRSKNLPVPRWLDRAPMQIPSVFQDA